MTELSYRRATIGDAKLLYEWANEPLVRKASFYSDTIIWENHVAWFKRKLKDSNAQILIFESENRAAGQVRIENGEEAIIGISIDEYFRGKKLAPMILKMSCKEFWKNNNNPVFAYIKTDNTASVKSFKKAGFKFERNDCVNGNDCFVYKVKNY
ncbi:GNAT family N-acetyltransferase [Plebeiibacterium marinum]|uniref:GNAT family N-acetyltransferase n=1 Tax=Plebeiibacterium marinum TaxID=2992111 RepID=A0AAE3MH97_9BACT|nr:GNAT family N-acetyltransferase [Plebeiobacterium marinum]MCW3807466.1 GNAT family N-acetyltransferase [Plebeiobacterium marinum]